MNPCPSAGPGHPGQLGSPGVPPAPPLAVPPAPSLRARPLLHPVAEPCGAEGGASPPMAGSWAGRRWASSGFQTRCRLVGRLAWLCARERGAHEWPLPPCPGAWAPPGCACWRWPCRHGPEVSGGAREGRSGDGGGELGSPGIWGLCPATVRGCASAAPHPGIPGFVPTLCALGGAGGPGRAENSRPLSLFPLFFCSGLPFPLLSWSLFSRQSLCVCSYKYILIKLEPYHRYSFVSCIFCFTK